MRERFVIFRVLRKINHLDINFLDFDKEILLRKLPYLILAEKIVKLIIKMCIIQRINSKININL